jgi:NAD(P)H-hydrate epimerase
LLKPRNPESNKGDYGHVLVAGGAEGKSGAAEMCGLAALRVGAGLTTVASSISRFKHPELMAAPLPQSWSALEPLLHRKRVLAIGPGLGTDDWTVSLVRDAVHNAKQVMVIDADALYVLAGYELKCGGRYRVLTPHPGEMSRLRNISIEQVQNNRLETAQACARDHDCVVILKGYRSVIAFPDGRTFINPTGSPALAKGGTGDILTGLIAGMLSQNPDDRDPAVLAAVYLHGLAGQYAARELSERCVLATDVLNHLPEAIRECQRASDPI